MRNSLIAVVFSLIIVAPLSAQVVLGGTADINAGVFIDSEKYDNSEISQTLVISPSLSTWTDLFDFSFLGSIVVEKPMDELDFEVNELLISLYPFDFMQIKAGRFSHLPGTAEFLSSTNYFSRTDYEKLLTGSMTDTGIPNDLIQLGFFISDFYLLFTAAPFKPNMLLPEVTSPWFPGKDIPTEVTISILLGKTTLYLNEIVYVEPDPEEYTLKNFSYSPEIGVTLGGVDISLIYYHGYDNTPLTKAKFILSGLHESDPYDIELTPYYRQIDAIGANIATSISSLRLWADASYTFEKAILSSRVSYVTRTSAVVSYPYFEYTIGGSYEIYDPSIFALLEIRNSRIIDGEDHLAQPLLGSAVTTGVNFSFFDSRLSVYFLNLRSFTDHSNVFVTRVSLDPTDSLSLVLTYPIFTGQLDTELGQFSEIKHLSINLEWRY